MRARRYCHPIRHEYKSKNIKNIKNICKYDILFVTLRQFIIVTMVNRLSKAQIKLVRSLQNKKTRDELQLFVAEGNKCINDLEGTFALRLKITLDNATPTEIAQMSSLRTPPGVIAVFEKAKQQAIDFSTNRLILALDGIQDPGNLGTIIRTCDWFGIYDIICSKDTADCYNPKVVQATMGALARVRMHYVDDLPQILSSFQDANYPIYGTLLEGNNMYAPNSIPNKEFGIIVMGNEGNGISPATREVLTHTLLIPSYNTNNTSESLNVSIATAIILAEFRRPI